MEYIILGGTTPISVLYYALLPDIAERLPGFAGNMIIHNSNLENNIQQVDNVLSNLSEQAWDRARRYINVCMAGKPSNQDDETIEKIFTTLPKSLREAKRRGKSFASVATHQF